MSIGVALRDDHGAFSLDVAFRAAATGVTALFGPSGAGKTTVLNAIAGLTRPRAGKIAIGSRVLFDSTAGIWVPARRRRIGYVFQEARLFPHLDVGENLRFGWRRAPDRMSEGEIGRIVEMLGLAPLLKRKPANLSGGEKGRVALGRALLANPELLLFDEPFAALDTARKNEILPYLERLRDEARLPMLYVSHSLDEVSRLANDMVILEQGRVVASGAVFDVLTDLELADYTGGSPYGTVLETRILHRSDTDGLTILSFAGGELAVPLLDKPVGHSLRTHIRAEDIMLAREEPRAISANNVLPVTIAAIRPAASGHVDVRLFCGTTALVARITRASSIRLELSEGMHLFAIVKSVTVSPQTGLA